MYGLDRTVTGVTLPHYCRPGNCITLQIPMYWVISQWQPTYKTEEVKMNWNFAYITSGMFQGYINSF